MSSFKLSEISPNTLVGRDVGKKIREKIKLLIEENEKIEIDMENKTNISPSFLEEAIVLLVIDLGKENFKNKISLININLSIKTLMNNMLSKRIKRKNEEDEKK